MTRRRASWGLLALACFLCAGPLAARQSLRLPWVFSDAPDLSADLGFTPGVSGSTHVELALGGRFAGFGLPLGAARAPRLEIRCSFTDPSTLERDARVLVTQVDLGDVLKEYRQDFTRSRFGSGSTLVYKAELATDLKPGDYNLGLTLKDEGLGIECHRTLHVIVPALDHAAWQVDDLRFITAIGQRLDEHGRPQRVLDPNPWRQVGGGLGWDLLVAYADRGPRPPGPLSRVHRVRRLRSGELVWQEQGPVPDKKPGQVWLLRVPAAALSRWKGGVYVLEAELDAGGRKTLASKTFEVLP
jgi:hypothetical protein